MNDPFVPGMKLILFVEAGLLLFGLELFVYFSLFIYCNKSLQLGTQGAKCSSKSGFLWAGCQKPEVSGVGSQRAETHPEHRGQGRGWSLDLGFGEPLLVCAQESGSEF